MTESVRGSSARGKAAQRHGGGRWLWPLAAAVLLLAAAWWAFGGSIMGNAQTATAYMTRVACSCRFVAERSLDDCGKDRLDGMELVTLSEDAEAKSVTARFPLLSSSTATWREGYGCMLERWDG